MKQPEEEKPCQQTSKINCNCMCSTQDWCSRKHCSATLTHWKREKREERLICIFCPFQEMDTRGAFHLFGKTSRSGGKRGIPLKVFLFSIYFYIFTERFSVSKGQLKFWFYLTLPICVGGPEDNTSFGLCGIMDDNKTPSVMPKEIRKVVTIFAQANSQGPCWNQQVDFTILHVMKRLAPGGQS